MALSKIVNSFRERLRHSRFSWGYALARMFGVFQWAGVVMVQRRSHDLGAREAASTYEPSVYYIMLLDKVRVNAYKNALRKYAAGRKVLDLGTGSTAILARLAIAAGAKSACGIEAGAESARVAQTHAQDPALAGKLQVVNSFSTDYVVPAGEPRYDLLVHEVIGSISSEEGVAAIVSDAKERLLTNDALHIPARSRTLFAPVRPPPRLSRIDAFLSESLYLGDNNADRTGVYYVANFPPAHRLSPSYVFESLELARTIDMVQKREHRIQLSPTDRATDAEVPFDGFVLWLELVVDPENVINSLTQPTSWTPVYVKLFETPIQLRVGDVLVVHTEADLRTMTPSYRLSVTLPDGQKAESSWSGYLGGALG